MLTPVTSSFYAYEGKYYGNKILALDLDGTIIRTRKARFPKDENDYAFLPNRIAVIKHYINNNYTIAFFTNQKRNPKTMILKVENVLADLIKVGIYPWGFIATKDDRKPNTGMWKYFESKFNHPIDYDLSFYIGDAAGRPQDHGDSDLKFSENIGLNFYYPEDLFPNNKIEIVDTQAMYISVGNQGSGKTSYYEDNLRSKGWFHANQDKIGTYKKVLKEIESNLKTGKSVYVDATNPGASKRKDYIDLAIKYQIPTLIIYFVKDGYGFNELRAENKVPTIAYSMYYKYLDEPTEEIDGVPVIEYF